MAPQKFINTHELTASAVRRHLRANDFTVEEYMLDLLSHIHKREPIVRAWAYLDPKVVLKRARELDSLSVEERGPLHGIPIGVKDVIYTQDMPTKHNSVIYEDTGLGLDAASVAILRRLGAVIFGKTTTTEFAVTIDGPETRNPHSLERTPGGSSSGSAVAVADFHVPLALGTQTGGSMMRPASFNGVFAMKPTWGAISNEGCKLFSAIFDTVGFFSRHIDDLRLLADAFRLCDDVVPRILSVRESRFAIIKTAQWTYAHSDTKKAVANAAFILQDEGAHVDEIELPSEFDSLHQWHKTVMNTDGTVTFYPEYICHRDKLDHTIQGWVENQHGLTHKDRLVAMDSIASLRPMADKILERYTAIITPSAIGEAPLGSKTGLPLFNTFWTALHVPVVNIPGFGGENSMPIGISLVSSRFSDQQLLHVAGEVAGLFQSRGGWRSSLCLRK